MEKTEKYFNIPEKWKDEKNREKFIYLIIDTLAQALRKKSEKEFGKSLFAFAYSSCDCSQGLGIFGSSYCGIKKIDHVCLKNIIVYNKDIKLFYNIDFNDLYNELIDKIKQIQENEDDDINII